MGRITLYAVSKRQPQYPAPTVGTETVNITADHDSISCPRSTTPHG